jgi:hypothetical protein
MDYTTKYNSPITPECMKGRFWDDDLDPALNHAGDAESLTISVTEYLTSLLSISFNSGDNTITSNDQECKPNISIADRTAIGTGKTAVIDITAVDGSGQSATIRDNVIIENAAPVVSLVTDIVEGSVLNIGDRFETELTIDDEERGADFMNGDVGSELETTEYLFTPGSGGSAVGMSTVFSKISQSLKTVGTTVVETIVWEVTGDSMTGDLEATAQDECGAEGTSASLNIRLLPPPTVELQTSITIDGTTYDAITEATVNENDGVVNATYYLPFTVSVESGAAQFKAVYADSYLDNEKAIDTTSLGLIFEEGGSLKEESLDLDTFTTIDSAVAYALSFSLTKGWNGDFRISIVGKNDDGATAEEIAEITVTSANSSPEIL